MTTMPELYRYLEGIPMDTHRVGEHWTEINDTSEDVDNAAEYEGLKKALSQSQISTDNESAKRSRSTERGVA